MPPESSSDSLYGFRRRAIWLVCIGLAFAFVWYAWELVLLAFAGFLLAIIHVLEGYILTPMVQKRAVRLLPILTVLSQLLMWMWAGLLGVAVATPLAAAGLVMVKMLYLHEEIEH